jgi:hypothetical protein
MVLWLMFRGVYRLHFAYWAVSATLNQLLTMARYRHLGDTFYIVGGFNYAGALISMANIAMFANVSWHFFRFRGGRNLRDSAERGFERSD